MITTHSFRYAQDLADKAAVTTPEEGQQEVAVASVAHGLCAIAEAIQNLADAVERRG